MEFLATVGPDTLINTFVVNIKGNQDIRVVNALQKALSEDLNYAPGKLNVERIPIILMQSGISTAHGMALTRFKQRIGVVEEGPAIELNMMVNSCMNPWQWSESIAELGEVLRWKILNNIGKLNDQPVVHEFIVTSDVVNGSFFAELLPDLERKESQYHLVIKFTFGSDELDQCFGPGTKLTTEEMKLHDMLDGKDEWNFTCQTREGGSFTLFLRVIDVPRFQHVDMSPYTRYPEKARYFMYGSEDDEKVLMSHCITKQPDFMEVVQLDLRPHGMSWDLIRHGVEVTIGDVDGCPKFAADGCTLSPLDNCCYDIDYRGREYAQCSSSISIENFKNEKYPEIFKAL